MGIKREIALLAGENGPEDLDHMIDVHFVGVHRLEGVCQLDACERLDDDLLNAAKHLSDDG